MNFMESVDTVVRRCTLIYSLRLDTDFQATARTFEISHSHGSFAKMHRSRQLNDPPLYTPSEFDLIQMVVPNGSHDF